MYQIPNTKNTGPDFLCPITGVYSTVKHWPLISCTRLTSNPSCCLWQSLSSVLQMDTACDDLVDLSVQVSRFSRISPVTQRLRSDLRLSDLLCHNRTWMIRTGCTGNVKQIWDKRRFIWQLRKIWGSLSCEHLKRISYFLLILESCLVFAMQSKCYKHKCDVMFEFWVRLFCWGSNWP